MFTKKEKKVVLLIIQWNVKQNRLFTSNLEVRTLMSNDKSATHCTHCREIRCNRPRKCSCRDSEVAVHELSVLMFTGI